MRLHEITNDAARYKLHNIYKFGPTLSDQMYRTKNRMNYTMYNCSLTARRGATSLKTRAMAQNMINNYGNDLQRSIGGLRKATGSQYTLRDIASFEN